MVDRDAVWFKRVTARVEAVTKQRALAFGGAVWN